MASRPTPPAAARAASTRLPIRRAGEALRTLTSRDCIVLGLVLIERLSITEAAVAMGVSGAQLRRDYETAVARVRRSLSPVLRRSAPRRSAPRAELKRAS